MVTGLVMVALFMVQRLDLLAFIGLVMLAVGGLAKLRLGYLVGGLRVVWILALVTLVFNLFLTPGTAIASFWNLTATQEGLERGGAMALRLFLLVFSTSLLTLTTSPILLTDSLEELFKPLKAVGVPTHELAMVCSIALRFVPTLARDTDRIMKAQMARGASLDRGNVLERAKALLPVLVPLFISALRYAEDLSTAMEARCYQGSKGRTRLRQLCFRNTDWAILLASVAGIAGIIGFDWWVRGLG